MRVTRWDRSDTEEVVKGVLIAAASVVLAKVFEELGDVFVRVVRKTAGVPKREEPKPCE